MYICLKETQGNLIVRQGIGLQVSKAKDVTKKNPIVLSRKIYENVFTIYFYSNTAANRVNPRENIMLRVLKSKWRTLAQKWYLKL